MSLLNLEDNWHKLVNRIILAQIQGHDTAQPACIPMHLTPVKMQFSCMKCYAMQHVV